MKFILVTTFFVVFMSKHSLFAQVNYNCGVGFTPRKNDLAGYNALIDTIKNNFDFTEHFFNMKWAELQGVPLDTAYMAGTNNAINNYLINQIHQSSINLLLCLDITVSNNRKKLNIPDTCLGVPCDSTFQNASVRQAYIHEATYIARKYKPAYFALAVEIDEYINVSTPAERNALLQAISVAMDSVKNIDPTIKTFVYFQFENTLCKNLWSIVKPFADSSDVFGFSSYPSAIGAVCTGTPAIFGSNLPNNYYDTVTTLWGSAKPIAFAELGEPSENNSVLPQASEQNQKNFIAQFKTSVSNLNVDFVNWIYLHDVNLPASVGGAYFNSMGLIHDTSGAVKPGYSSFKCDGTNLSSTENHEEKAVLLYPNPATKNITISCRATTACILSIRLYNSLGQLMNEYSLDAADKKNHQVQLNIEKFPAGIYSVLIHTDNGTISKKTIVYR